MTVSIRLAAGAAAILLTFGGVTLLVAGDNSPEATLAVAPPGGGGATGLSLAPGLSFTDDSSAVFPIRGHDLGDGKIAADRPTVVFFGTSHCWNTNREAERFVLLFQKHRDEARFLVVDLSSPSSDQRPLVAKLYRGFIPTLAFFDRQGKVVYNRAGETARERGDASALEEILKRAKYAGTGVYPTSPSSRLQSECGTLFSKIHALNSRLYVVGCQSIDSKNGVSAKWSLRRL